MAAKNSCCNEGKKHLSEAEGGTFLAPRLGKKRREDGEKKKKKSSTKAEIRGMQKKGGGGGKGQIETFEMSLENNNYEKKLGNRK